MTNKAKLTPKKDYAFTRLFSKAGNESMLIDFIESVINRKIKSLEVIPEARLQRTSKQNKYGILDLKARLNDGTIVDIELQIDEEKYMENRMTFYSSKLISEELRLGDKYEELNDVIVILILGYNMLNTEGYHNSTITVLKEHRDYLIETPVTYHFIELKKFRKIKPDLDNRLDQWVLFIDGEEEELIKMAAVKNKEIEKAVGEWKYLTGDEEIKRLEFLELKGSLDRNSQLSYAEERGEKRGIRKGIKQGSRKSKLEIAKKMLESKVPVENIIEYTGLTKEEIVGI